MTRFHWYAVVGSALGLAIHTVGILLMGLDVPRLPPFAGHAVFTAVGLMLLSRHLEPGTQSSAARRRKRR